MKSERDKIRPHENFPDEKLTRIVQLSEKDPVMHALVLLQRDMAARIQDLVGLTFGEVMPIEG